MKRTKTAELPAERPDRSLLSQSLLLALEPRFMFDGAGLASGIDGAPEPPAPPADDTDTSSETQTAASQDTTETNQDQDSSDDQSSDQSNDPSGDDAADDNTTSSASSENGDSETDAEETATAESLNVAGDPQQSSLESQDQTQTESQLESQDEDQADGGGDAGSSDGEEESETQAGDDRDEQDDDQNDSLVQTAEEEAEAYEPVAQRTEGPTEIVFVDANVRDYDVLLSDLWDPDSSTDLGASLSTTETGDDGMASETGAAPTGETGDDPGTGTYDYDSGSDPAATSLSGGDTGETGSPNIQIVILDADRDGVEQITEYLSQYEDVAAVHILAHGSSGALRLGNTVLHHNNVKQYEDQLQDWGQALSDDGDILIYGCNVAASDSGIDFVNDLSQITGADVAASNDDTGAAQFGGDWQLEVSTGTINTGLVISPEAQLEWQDLMATVAVTTTLDENDGDTSSIAALLASPGGSGVSLREAIIAANNTPGNDFITLGAGTFTLTIVGSDDTGAAGDLDILELNGDDQPSGKLTITGAGAGATIIDADGLNDRVFHVLDGGHLEINGVTVSEGFAGGTQDGGGLLNESGILQINDSIVSYNISEDHSGGGIANIDGILEINNSRVFGNQADASYFGGGIANLHGIVALNNVEVDSNSAGRGGGLGNHGGIVTIVDSHFYGNSTFAGGEGGGLFQSGSLFRSGGVLDIDNTDIVENSAAEGGGVAVLGGIATIDNSEISRNDAGIDGGGILNLGTLVINQSVLYGNESDGYGGGIANLYDGVATITGTDITYNVAYYGGGVSSTGGSVIIVDSRIERNGHPADTSGGGIFNGFYSTLLVENSSIDYNIGFSAGGLLNQGTATFVGSTVNHNSSGVTGTGGGIQNLVGTLTFQDTTVNYNTAEYGGGIANIGGNVLLVDSEVRYNSAAQYGGGIFNATTETGVARLTLLRTEVSNNTADLGGGISNNGSEEGGALLTALYSQIDNNAAAFYGGGIFNNNFGNQVALYNSQVNYNQAGYGGGGIWAGYGTQLNVANSHIDHNTAGDAEAFYGYGGGLFGYSSQVSLYNSTVSNNTASAHGGGMLLQYGSTLLASNSQINNNNAAYGYGGGIAARGGPFFRGQPTLINLHDTSVDYNTAWGGGGVAVLYGTLTAVDSSISHNTAYYDGGGIHALYSTVSVIGTSEDASQLNDNRALGLGEGYGEGGAILSRYGPLTLINTEVDNNTAVEDGGAVQFSYGLLTLIDVNLENNTAGDDGGALDLRDHTTFVVDSTFNENDAGDNGGAINSRYGSLTIDNSVFTNNRATGLSGENYGNGGAIDFRGYGDGEEGVTLYAFTLTNSTVTDNTAAYDGGGLHLHYADAVIRDSIIDNNTSNNVYYGGGGGIFSFEGNLHIHSSEIDGNTAANDGGGVYVLNDSEEFGFSITDSQLTGNTAYDDGGGLHENVYSDGVIVGTTFAGNTATYDGGGIYTEGRLNLINSTVSGNTAGYRGGGIFDESDLATNLVNATIVYNTAYGYAGGVFGDLTGVKNTIIALNTDAGNGLTPDIDGSFTSYNHNFIGADTLAAFGAAEDQTGTLAVPFDPLLNPLADNGSTLTLPGGGVPQTHAPQPGSPVIDAASINGSLPIPALPGTDQRSFLRPAGADIDIGALEYGATEIGFTATTNSDVVDNDTSSTANLLADAAAEGDDISLRELVIASNNTPGSEIINLDGDLGDYTLYGSGDNTAANGDLDILDVTGKITIRHDDGEESDPNITSDEGDDRIFHLVGHGTALHLIDVDVTYGAVTGLGGGILVNRGYLHLDDVDVFGHSAGDDSPGRGGGIANREGQVFVEDSNISGNYAYNYGGGIFNEDGLLRITGTAIGADEYGNTAYYGGGVANLNGLVTLSSSFVEFNDAGFRGGGLFNRFGVVFADETAFNYNDARYGNGGGISNHSGGVLFMTGDEDNAIADNSADDDGGGVNNSRSVAVFDGTRIQDNYAQDRGGGVLNGYGSAFFLNEAAINDNELDEGYGGAVFNHSGTVLFDDTNLLRNTASYGGGLQNVYGTVQLINSEVSDNEAYGAGGGIRNNSGLVGLFNGTVVNDNGYGEDDRTNLGGGILNSGEESGANLLAVGATVNGNSAYYGGGIYNLHGQATLIDTEVDENHALDAGGGIFSYGDRAGLVLLRGGVQDNVAGEYGAGIANRGGGSLTVLESSESIAENDNAYGGSGGGILNQGSSTSAIVFDSTISNNNQDAGGFGVNGGGISNYRASLIVLDSRINDNSSEGGYGGGLHNTGPSAQAMVVNTEVDGNESEGGNGSAMFNNAQLLVHGGDIQGNETEGGDGTIFNTDHLVLNNVLVGDPNNIVALYGLSPLGNGAEGGSGGGVFNYNASAFLLNGTNIAGNWVEADDGAGVWTGAEEGSADIAIVGATIRGNQTEAGWGGGIFNLSESSYDFSSVLMVDSTVAYNQAENYGGGINSRGGGTLLIQNSHVDHNVSSGSGARGGGIYSDEGRLFLNQSSVDHNAVYFADVGGGGIFNDYGRLLMRNSSASYNTVSGDSLEYGGGGLLNTEGSVADIFRSSFDHNASSKNGGGITNASGSVLRITQSSIDNNYSQYFGGGLFGSSHPLNEIVRINLSTVNENDLGGPHQYGGGVANQATMSILSSSISNNTAYFGGGLWNDYEIFVFGSSIINNTAVEQGGGIGNDGGELLLYNSTISGNSALYGGGLFNASGEIVSINNTIANNETLDGGSAAFYNSDEVFMHNTIVAINIGGVGDIGGAGGFSPGTSSYNFIGNGDGGNLVNGAMGNQVGTGAAPLDPLLDGLANNSSPFRLGPGENELLLTHLPRNGSPVIDTGTSYPGGSLHPSGDQRNVNRPVGLGVDIGALERSAIIDNPGGSTPPVPTVTVTAPGVGPVTVTPTPGEPGVIFTVGMNERWIVFEREYPRLLRPLVDALGRPEGLLEPLGVHLERLILLTYQEVLFINGLIPEPVGDDTGGSADAGGAPGNGDAGEPVGPQAGVEAGDVENIPDDAPPPFAMHHIPDSATLSTQLHNAESFESGRTALLAAAMAAPVARRNKGDP